MKLLGKRVILKEIEEVKPKSIIVVAERPKSPFILGKVIAVGDEVILVKLKDTILVNRQMTGLVEWEGEMCGLVLEEEIIAYGK